ncbi:MAG: phosphoglycerate mutase (2,3-diphosphoglycerate-independent) [Planctomycetes bacterium TMED75]|nr:phosphoglycerate mutase (2,3-diphosphoglycerate-independent) [Planctomycetaceae bacterium]OUU91689.1 MAG: phosphoglycerate mutase (2,3-diphosphoglycerate-independent) [Planctomycetes bacterium TMED75]
MDHPPCLLVIRDGWGRNPHPEHDAFNAIHLARTPVADRLENEWPSTLVKTSGTDVGLPIGADGPVMGNSEVGHQNIGAGRIVNQELMRITESIRSGAFFENAGLDAAFGRVESTGGTVHLLGLVSDGQVHSDIEHLLALITMAQRRGCPADKLRVHAITDGRDTTPRSGAGYLQRVEAALKEAGFPPIASVLGRFWAMDRDHRWDRIERAFDCLVGGRTLQADQARTALEHHYETPEDPELIGDEFMPPTSLGSDAQALDAGRIKDGDSVIFFNFRGDRPRELIRAFTLDDAEFSRQPRGGFQRRHRPEPISITGMTRYESGLPIEVAFEKPDPLPHILGAVLEDSGLRQFRCAETEKFPHVTFFFNDYREDPFEGETRALVPSPTDVQTYDQKPEMSAVGVRDAVLERIRSKDREELIIVNFANGDMVGHTGNLEAAITACEFVDECVGILMEETLARGGTMIITADHGNAEQMWNTAGDCPHTAHTNYDVPLHLVGECFRDAHLHGDGRLADIAPTLLAMLGVDQPKAMTGRSLID